MGVERQVAGSDQRVRLDAGRPHQGVGVELVAVAQHDVVVLRRSEQGLGPHLDAAPAELLGGPPPHLRADLREDLVGGLDEHPPHVPRLDRGEVAARLGGHVLQLGEGLHAREAGTHEDERQCPPPYPVVGGRGHQVELGEHVVAQVDGLFQGLEADAALGEAGDRERPGDRTGREHEIVVLEPAPRPPVGLEVGRARGEVDPGHPAAEDLASRQDAAQEDDDVPRLHAPGRRLRQEGLVGHVGVQVDHGHAGLVAAEPPLQAEGREHPDVAASHDEHARDSLSHTPGRTPPETDIQRFVRA